MATSPKKFRTIFAFYWIFLAYTIAALVWWYIELMQQSKQMAQFRLMEAAQHPATFVANKAHIKMMEKRKQAQYLGEGVAFLLLIAAGSIYVYRTFRNRIKDSMMQQNFMMAITHELKTPIAVTKLNLETLQKHKLGEAQQQKFIANTLQEANRLDALCNNLLLSSQLESGRYNITSDEQDFSGLVQGCVHQFNQRNHSRIINKNIADNIFVQGDKLLLELVVNNLMENAIKYSPKEMPVSVSLEAAHGKALLKVADFGSGISAKEKEKVFLKHYRMGNEATRMAKGTGLGLYLVKNIVNTHNGQVSIYDNSPTGSIFVVTLNANS